MTSNFLPAMGFFSAARCCAKRATTRPDVAREKSTSKARYEVSNLKLGSCLSPLARQQVEFDPFASIDE